MFRRSVYLVLPFEPELAQKALSVVVKIPLLLNQRDSPRCLGNLGYGFQGFQKLNVVQDYQKVVKLLSGHRNLSP